jgi:ribonuclease P protein component
MNDSSSQVPFRNTLNKSERIKSKKLIDDLFSNGSSFFLSPLKIIYIQANKDDNIPCKAAFVVSKRNFKQAVDRNKIKRMLRESFRTQKEELIKSLIHSNKKLALVFIYSNNKMPQHKVIKEKVKQCLIKLIETL